MQCSIWQYNKICQFWSLKENKLLAIINSQKSNICAWHSGWSTCCETQELNLDVQISYEKPRKPISDDIEDEDLGIFLPRQSSQLMNTNFRGRPCLKKYGIEKLRKTSRFDPCPPCVHPHILERTGSYPNTYKHACIHRYRQREHDTA